MARDPKNPLWQGWDLNSALWTRSPECCSCQGLWPPAHLLSSLPFSPGVRGGGKKVCGQPSPLLPGGLSRRVAVPEEQCSVREGLTKLPQTTSNEQMSICFRLRPDLT